MKPLSTIRTILAALFGSLNWSSPPWLQRLQQKAKTNPKSFWGTLLLALILLSTAVYAVVWYKNLPKPQYTTARITAPNITPNEETLVPNNLIIDFGIDNNGFSNQSVAPINDIGKIVKENIVMTPEIPGQWLWNNDSQLIFTPTEDWPAGQKYTIHFANKFFAANTKMERYDFSFATQNFEASIPEFKFYQDPVHSEVRYAVATIQFNFPVNTESLEKNTSLMFQTIENGKANQNAEALKFSYTYDAHKRIAYLHSDPVTIKNTARYLLLTLNKALSSSTGSSHLTQEISKNVLIPDATNFMKVINATASIVRNDKDRPEQVLTVETSLGLNETEFNKYVHFYLLPKDYPATSVEPAKQNYQWQNPGEVTDSILSLATPLVKQAIPTEYNYSTLHSFKFASQTPRYLYIKIDKGMKGFGDFSLSTDYTSVIPVPELPKEISFLHKGSLLALSGEKKLSVLIRGLPAVKYDFARVLPNNINQLVTQTHGDFNNPYFNNPSFNQQNISQIYTDIQQYDISDLTKQQYTALDLSKYLSASSNTSGPQGLFLLQATGWDVEQKVALDVKASRLILITDLGMLVKDNRDGSHDLFIQSITQGAPVANVTVSILGKNGLPLLSRVSDAEGRVTFPDLKDFIEDKEPTVYIASLNNDISFIPFSNSNRQLNFTKFDVGGLYTNNQELQSLSAYLFSDRGIYRPGDKVHIGMIIKQAFVQPQPAGLPLQATITDPRGVTVKDLKFSLNETGFMDLDFTTDPNSPTGQYQINLFLVKDDHPQNLLGSTTVKVSEFQPDRMRITTSLMPKPGDGWSSPIGLKAEVNLWNLYGAPATDRRISGKIVLTPKELEFSDFPDYVFADPLRDPKKPPKIYSESLSDLTTNSKGQAEFNLNLDRFEKGTYELTFFAEGFEALGGRSVASQSKALISPLAYFIGYKPDGDLSFIKQEAVRTINYIAIDPELKKEEIKDLRIQLVSLHPVTTLVKNSNGTYQYQSIIHSTIISTQAFSISEQGNNYTLPTNQIGDFTVTVLAKDDTPLSQLKFTVVGDSQRPLSKNAELSIKLNKSVYQPNEIIEIQITAPYTGSGLITIERDKVFTSHHFKTDTTSSLQTIQIPADFQGDGYINVAFIRDWDSPEIFISPLSYSVVPFEVNHDAHAIKIDLQTAKVARPGDNFTIDYHSDKPGKIIVFAVDEGILQVARYATPDPLAFFFQKHALEVLTQQTVDQILPKFIQDRELSAVGGDDGDEGFAGRLNPFKRKTDLPVAFWSGIMDTDTTNRQVTYPIPDYFNGSLKIMAVAVATDSVGANETTAEIRGDFIINPNVPTFAAPGDTFEVTASIANNVKDSGEHAKITVDLTTSSEIELVGPAQQELEIPEGHEQTVRFSVRAKEAPGAAKLTFKANSGAKLGTMNATLSIRPANPFTSYINSGVSYDASKSLDVLQSLFPEFRAVDVAMSNSPLILVFGLQRYLENFPYGCTEQLTSKALPLLAMNSQSWFIKDSNQINEKMNATFQMLNQRQMSNGAFSYWPNSGDNQGTNFASVYAMHFLTEAKEQGFNVPNEAFYKGISFLKDLASQNATDLDTARIQAYAIYLLTRNEIVTTNYLANLQLYLVKDSSNAWEKDITAVYIAASYQMLKSFNDANQLINKYKPQEHQTFSSDFYNSAIADAQYMYLLAKHFPDRLNQQGDTLLLRLVKAINNDEINTVLSGYTSLALSAFGQANSSVAGPASSITITNVDGKKKTVPAENAVYQKLALDSLVRKITMNNPAKNRYFYQLNQQGFDKKLTKEVLKQGMEIYREYRNSEGSVISSTTLGAEIEVHIHVRSLNSDYLSNIAIEDLLPGGFEVVTDSVKNNAMDYIDIREDRVIFFGSVESTVRELVYKIKATSAGKFTVPPVYAEAMYNPNTKARGVASEILVRSEP